MAVIDASVQVALVNAADPYHSVALTWYRDTLVAGEALFAPWILPAEVAAALSRGLGDLGLAHRAVNNLVDDQHVQLVVVDGALATAAVTIAVEHRIRGCDAVYVALAMALAEPLVTLDRQQSERAAEVVSVVVPGAATTGGSQAAANTGQEVDHEPES